MTQVTKKNRYDWVGSVPFFGFHVVAFVLAFVYPPSLKLLGFCALSYYARMFLVTAGYHRYFSHRTYRTSRPMQFLLALLGTTTLQKGALWWAAHHRHHHKHSDQPGDVHSPLLRGFWWSHMGWVVSHENNATRWELIPDLARFKELRWVDRHHWVAPLAVGALLLASGGSPLLVWAGLVPTVLLWHGTFTINSLSHVFGGRRYETTDTSRNNPWLALITLGEGWHNNHHCYQSSTRQGFFWWEIDVSYYVLRGMRAVGLVRDLREPPLATLEARRIERKKITPTAETPVAALLTIPGPVPEAESAFRFPLSDTR